MNTAVAKRRVGPAPDKCEYKVIVSPTREGWKYVVQMRRTPRHAWADFAPFRTFNTRAQAEAYAAEMEES